jgi:hypothetical protein
MHHERLSECPQAVIWDPICGLIHYIPFGKHAEEYQCVRCGTLLDKFVVTAHFAARGVTQDDLSWLKEMNVLY